MMKVITQAAWGISGIATGAGALIAKRGIDSIIAGKTNNLFTIGVTYGYGTRKELTAANADQICTTPAGVTTALNT